MEIVVNKSTPIQSGCKFTKTIPSPTDWDLGEYQPERTVEIILLAKNEKVKRDLITAQRFNGQDGHIVSCAAE